MMDIVPDDILLLIFSTYVHHAQRTPVNLLPVCRRWRDLVLPNRSLWSRIIIHVRSIKTVPLILDAQYHLLDTYLSRSWVAHVNNPLYISIFWHESVNHAEDHSFTCGLSPLEVFNCPQSPCLLQLTYERQLEALLQTIFSWTPRYSGVKVEETVVWRCRSLEIDLGGFNRAMECSRRSISLSPLGKREPDGYSYFPSLRSLTLHHFIASIPYLHASKLEYLELDKAGFDIYPNLESIEWLHLNRPILYRGTGGFSGRPPWSQWVNLRTLEISSGSRIDFLSIPAMPAMKSIIFRAEKSLSALRDLTYILQSLPSLDALAILGPFEVESLISLDFFHPPRVKKLILGSHPNMPLAGQDLMNPCAMHHQFNGMHIFTTVSALDSTMDHRLQRMIK